MFIKDIINGHEEFKTGFYTLHEKEYLKSVKQNQNPKALFIGCADSRVMPDVITNSKPGNLFTVRNIGNFVPKFDDKPRNEHMEAALEFAINNLKVQEIIVCGHSHCGAIEGLFNSDLEQSAPLSKWLKMNEKVKKLTSINIDKNIDHQQKLRIAEKFSILCQIENLLTYPLVYDKVKAKELFVHGWYFKIGSGELEYYDTLSQTFNPISQILEE